MEYMVASGKSILTKAGQVNEYQAITAKMIGSASIFDGLIKIGTIVEKGTSEPTRVHRVDLRPVAKASVKSVEVIEPEVIEVGKPDMPDEKPKRKYTKKLSFGAEKKEETEEVEEIPVESKDSE